MISVLCVDIYFGRRSLTGSPVGVRPGIPDAGLKGVSGPATGIDRPCTESSAGARGASDEERGS